MKICSACRQELPKEKFSKKQWQAKQQRRCKECVAENREVNLEAPNDALQQLSLSKVSSNDNDVPPSPSTNGEVAPSWTDDDLFKKVSPNEECPICMLTLPSSNSEIQYQPCCGKILCCGCMYAAYMADHRCLCPFCRTPGVNSEGEYNEMLSKRAEGNDAAAIHQLGCLCREGGMGLPQDRRKAFKLHLRAGELGYASAYNKIGYAYYNGLGVERDTKKAQYYFELAAMAGNVVARHCLGAVEGNAGNITRAMKHFMIAAGAGDDDSLTKIREFFLRGHASKDDFERALRAHKEAKDEMKSEQREAAAAARAAGQYT